MKYNRREIRLIVICNQKERDSYGYKEIASDHPDRRRVRWEIQSPSNWWEEESGHFIRYRNVQYTSIAKSQEEHQQKYTQEIGDRAGCLSCHFLYPCPMHSTRMFSLKVSSKWVMLDPSWIQRWWIYRKKPIHLIHFSMKGRSIFCWINCLRNYSDTIDPA